MVFIYDQMYERYLNCGPNVLYLYTGTDIASVRSV